MDVLVTENLFHNRPGITHIYDLKGSLRKRLITNAEGIAQENTSVDTPVRGSWDDPAHPNGSPVVPVLLDQNFINDSLENPIYLRLHSKVNISHWLFLLLYPPFFEGVIKRFYFTLLCLNNLTPPRLPRQKYWGFTNHMEVRNGAPQSYASSRIATVSVTPLG